jgi:hypothetical protein
MTRVSITPLWTIRLPDAQTMPARLLDLLTAVRQHGSLSAACQAAGTSYRLAWDLIRQGEALFDQLARQGITADRTCCSRLEAPASLHERGLPGRPAE